MKLSQKGFSAVEIIVTIVLVGLIGTVGWLVYDRQKTNDRAAKSDTATDSKQTDSAEPQSTPSEEGEITKQFQIKEFDVEFASTASLSGLYYVIGNEGRTAYFSTEELKNTDCAADKTAQIALTRYTEQELTEEPAGESIKSEAKKLGDYYYLAIGGQAACSEDAAVLEKATSMRRDIARILPDTLTAIE